MLPFTTEQFFDVFAAYNRAIWPVHVVIYAAAVLVLVTAARRPAWSGRGVLILLGVAWLLNGIGYHFTFFARINPAAYVFGGLFVIQGLAFLTYAIQRPLQLVFAADVPTAVAVSLIAYALVGYSAIGIALGHGWPRMPVFGVAPCPTTIFTLAMMMMVRPRPPWWLTVIPLIWAAIGTSAALLLGVPEDLGLPVAAIAFGLHRAVGRSAQSAAR